MASEGPLYPGAAANDATVGTTNWVGRFGPTLLTAISADDAVVGWSDNNAGIGPGVTSKYLVVTNFGFSIPTGATIDGIVVELERDGGGDSQATDNGAFIVKGGTIGSTDKSSATVWSGTTAIITYGGSSDLWGESWSHTDINASTFGFAYSVTNPTGFTINTPRADYVRVTVYYTEGGGGGAASRLTKYAQNIPHMHGNNRFIRIGR